MVMDIAGFLCFFSYQDIFTSIANSDLKRQSLCQINDKRALQYIYLYSTKGNLKGWKIDGSHVPLPRPPHSLM
jgi:hypothetical protein